MTIQPEPAIFDGTSRAEFARLYPETPGRIGHNLRDHALLTLPALADLSERLDADRVEYNLGDLPVGIAAQDVPANGRSIGDTIRNIDSAKSWAVLKNVESDPAYRALLHSLLGELEPDIVPRTGAMKKLQAYIFISSPGSMTPYHFDPEHNILLQLRGTKTMRVYPPGDVRFAPQEAHESYHRGGNRNLGWDDAFADGGTDVALDPGQAIYVPVMAPHYVRSGPEPSISLSITWRSSWSVAEANAHAFNGTLRKLGLKPKAPGRFPAQNKAKALAWGVVRRAEKKPSCSMARQMAGCSVRRASSKSMSSLHRCWPIGRGSAALLPTLTKRAMRAGSLGVATRATKKLSMRAATASSKVLLHAAHSAASAPSRHRSSSFRVTSRAGMLAVLSEAFRQLATSCLHSCFPSAGGSCRHGGSACVAASSAHSSSPLFCAASGSSAETLASSAGTSSE